MNDNRKALHDAAIYARLLRRADPALLSRQERNVIALDGEVNRLRLELEDATERVNRLRLDLQDANQVDTVAPVAQMLLADASRRWLEDWKRTEAAIEEGRVQAIRTRAAMLRKRAWRLPFGSAEQARALKAAIALENEV